MNFRSIRVRLVSWYAFWLGVVFIVAGVLTYLGVKHNLERNLVRIQEYRADRIAAVLARFKGGSPTELAQDIETGFAPEATDRFIRILRPDGTVVYQSGTPRDLSFDPALISPGPHPPGVRREQPGDQAEMVIVTKASDQRTPPGFLLECGESLGPALRELTRLLLSLGVAFAVVAVIALVGGLALVSRALRPVDEIVVSAERITSHNLSERLAVASTGDEFETLTQALNRMIVRLDEAVQHNRRFLSDASHELRTPLTILRGELEALFQRDDLNVELQGTLGNLLEEVERLARIVETLVALSRLETGQARAEYARFDLAALATSTVHQMALLAEDKHQTFRCEASSPVLVEGDRSRLKQVIVNLLDNAIKYTPEGGSVQVTVSQAGDEAVCEVTDTGVGIPPEAIPRIFDRFYRVDSARSRQQGGAGIGLSIVKVISAAHGGRIEVESAVGRGSTFRLRLPLAPQAPGPAPAA